MKFSGKGGKVGIGDRDGQIQEGMPGDVMATAYGCFPVLAVEKTLMALISFEKCLRQPKNWTTHNGID